MNLPGGGETASSRTGRCLRLGSVTGAGSPLPLSDEVTRLLMGMAEAAMPTYLSSLKECTAVLETVFLDSPLVRRQGFDLASMRTLLHRGWLMDLAVGAAVLSRGLVVPETGGAELYLGPETDHLSRLCFGLNVWALPEEELTVGELWIGWPPGRAWSPPSRVLGILAGWLRGTERSDCLPPDLDPEQALLLRHYGFLRGHPPSLTPALPLISGGSAEARPLIACLSECGRGLAEAAAVPVLRGLPFDFTRLVFMRLLLEVAGLRATEAGVVPEPSAGDVRRWVWLGPPLPGVERWHDGGP